jgi:2-C-methyl-D-erythritol 2,4-cyclodiphosphate synthase
MSGRIRIGHGYDVHAFGDGDRIVLGGVQIPHSKALLAHSDGDVALHALSDAILGALGLGDIGHHFPDDDPALKGVDSRVLLRKVVEHMQASGYEVGNVDVTIIAQRPKLVPYIDAMCTNIASDLKTDRSNCNVKATTTEKLGFVGREEGIAVHAVALLSEINPT